jgi:DNA-binding IclR family transcriptional regulator
MRTVSRALSIFGCFSASAPKLTLQEIATRLQLAKSTTFRLVGALEDQGYLVRLQDQRYCLSLRFGRLGALAQSTLDVRQIARPVMESIARSARVSVTLFTVDGQEFVCLDVCAAAAPSIAVVRPGARAPLGLGAASLHPQIVGCQALAAGNHISFEKPTAKTNAEPVELCRATVRAGVKHCVVQDKL